MPQLSRTNPVAPSIIFFLSATWVRSMAVRVSYPIKFDGWARDKGRSRYELCDVMLTNSFTASSLGLSGPPGIAPGTR